MVELLSPNVLDVMAGKCHLFPAVCHCCRLSVTNLLCSSVIATVSISFPWLYVCVVIDAFHNYSTQQAHQSILGQTILQKHVAAIALSQV